MSDKQASFTGREIAVIGMSCRFPGARNVKEFWKNLRAGVESVRQLSEEELLAAGEDPQRIRDPHYVRAASLLEDVDLFDAAFFGYNAREAEIMDPQQRLFLEHAWEALEDSGYSPSQYEGLIGVYAGVAWNTYLLSNLSTHLDLFEGSGGFQVFITNDKDFMPTRLSYKLNLKGPSLIIQTSCSTSLVAVHLASLSLLNYECDIALAGGVTVKVPQKNGYFYQEGGLASPDGHCRAFDAKAAGTIFGSGAGIVVLKRLSDALQDGDNVRAIIRGTAINNDGAAKVSYTAPSVEGQADVIAAAQAMAGVPAETIQYVETHGTGTSLGDPVEVTALTRAFRESTQRKNFCALGSVKTNFGHLDAAAGIAGFIKAVLSLENAELPPSLNYERPNPAIEFEKTPFYVNAALQRWERNGSPRRAAVSSFGVGGTNAHVILEEAPLLESSSGSRSHQLLLLSARTPSALQNSRQKLLAYIREHDNVPLADVAFSLQNGRTVFRNRLALVCKDHVDAADGLESGSRRPLMFTDKEEPRDRSIVFMFSGQGSQYLNMSRGLYENETAFRDQVDLCARLLMPHIGLDIATVLFPTGGKEAAAADQLAQTRYTQPALFVVEYALASLWKAWGVNPRAMIGHSIGEYVAATLAGVMSLEEALALVAIRARLMQQQPPGRMLAVEMAEENLLPLLSNSLDLAAVNSPSNCVVAGAASSIERLERELTRSEIDFRPLHTSHAFHSRMMDPVLEPFTEEVRKIRLNPPSIPYLSNVTGNWIRPEQATSPRYWADHLRAPVRFSQGLNELFHDPERIFLEVGPGRTLSSLASHHPSRKEHVALSSLRHPTEQTTDEAKLLEILGRLWMAGVKPDWTRFYADERRRRVSLPPYPFERQRFWIDPLPRGQQRKQPGQSGAIRKPDIADWFYLPSWRASLTPVAPDRAQGPSLVFVDHFGLGDAVAELLERQGRDVISVRPGDLFLRQDEHTFLVEPGNPGHFVRLFEELKANNLLPGTIVHAWSLTADGPHAVDISEFEDSQQTGFYSLLYLLQALGKYSDSAVDLSVVSNHVQPAASARVAPEKSPMLALCRVAPQEFPGLRCRLIDVDLGVHTDPLPEEGFHAALAARIVAEVDTPSQDAVIAYAGTERWVQAFEAVRIQKVSAQPLRTGGTYLLTGGLHGNGFSIARYLASRFQANLVLLDSTGSSPAGASGTHEVITTKARVQRLQALGARVLVISADLTNDEQIQKAWTDAEARFGQIHGVIHAEEPVGENTFRTISELQPEDISLLFRPKVHALFALERVLQTKKVQFCILLSSIASVLGGVGYSGYTAGNLFMDSFARDRNRLRRLRWLSLNCDLWLSEDRRDEITQVRSDIVELAMSEAEGEEVFARVLGSTVADQVLVSTGDLGARIAEARQRAEGRCDRERDQEQQVVAAVLHARPSLPTPYVAPETELQKRITAVWQTVLGFERIGLDDNFFELGGDSLVAIQVAKRLKQELKMDFPVARLYQGVTVRALAELLGQNDSQISTELAEELGGLKETAIERRKFLERARARKQQVRA